MNDKELEVIEKYTFISNSCVATFLYQHLFHDRHIALIDFNNPFISTWIPDDEQYVQFCENYEYYTSLKPRFGEPINLKWEKEKGSKRQYPSILEEPYYPVMFLEDIEIHWAHDRDNNPDHREKLVWTKYHGRLESSKPYEPIFLWCYHEMYNTHTEEERKELIRRFTSIKPKKIFLTNIREEELYTDNTIIKYIPEWEGKIKGDYNQNLTGNIFKEIVISNF